jgi:hypothetical protein
MLKQNISLSLSLSESIMSSCVVKDLCGLSSDVVFRSLDYKLITVI